MRVLLTPGVASLLCSRARNRLLCHFRCQGRFKVVNVGRRQLLHCLVVLPGCTVSDALEIDVASGARLKRAWH